MGCMLLLLLLLLRWRRRGLLLHHVQILQRLVLQVLLLCVELLLRLLHIHKLVLRLSLLRQ